MFVLFDVKYIHSDIVVVFRQSQVKLFHQNVTVNKTNINLQQHPGLELYGVCGDRCVWGGGGGRLGGMGATHKKMFYIFQSADVKFNTRGNF